MTLSLFNRRLPLRTLAFVLGVAFALTGCSRERDALPAEPPTPRRVAVEKYADVLMQVHGDLLLARDLPQQTLADPQAGFLVKFTVDRPAWLTQQLRFEGDTVTRDQNLVVTEAWQRLFCTKELQQVLRQQRLMTVAGQIVDRKGGVHSVALCTASTAAKSINDRDRIK
ncbi:hypothetical protein [Variovorax sp. OK605]|uniref:hypothetical protein n=1 Tax=Variovorax sp. OK605 TaxID=1855317 RepID=UPI0011607F32|nr:hypothetical protein [Variovorax sp. OK605]